MFSFIKLIILFFSIILFTEFVNAGGGMNCFELPLQIDCVCSDQTGAIGTCICPTSARHNQPCAIFNGVDSVRDNSI
jgi:hypothetical protein